MSHSVNHNILYGQRRKNNPFCDSIKLHTFVVKTDTFDFYLKFVGVLKGDPKGRMLASNHELFRGLAVCLGERVVQE